jgi:hypothetical protein
MPRNTPPPRRPRRRQRAIDWKRVCKCRKFVHSHVDSKDVCTKCRRPIAPERMKAYREELRALHTLAGVDD